jgi:hypothetical protein
MFLLASMLAVGLAQPATPLTLEEAAARAAGEAPSVVRTRAETERARAQSVTARSRLGPAL